MTSVLVPSSIGELAEVLVEHPDTVLVAGGTLAVPASVRERRNRMVCLTERLGLDHVTPDRCGATVTLAALASSEAPAVLREAARSVGFPAVRNMATVGGNVAAGTPGCVAVALLALGASAWVLESDGTCVQLPVAKVVGASARPIVELTWPDAGPSGFEKLRVPVGGGATLTSVAVSTSNRLPYLVSRVACGGSGTAELPSVRRVLREHRDADVTALASAAATDLGWKATAYRSQLVGTLVHRIGSRLSRGSGVQAR